jgi:uroporphyrinogen-III synthase
MAPTVLVTRPEPQASQWADALRQLGLDARPLPLMATGAPADPAAVIQLWLDLAADAAGDPDVGAGASALARPARWRALMFVSPAAVQWFFRQRPNDLSLSHWPQVTCLAAPGLGTAQALRQALGAWLPQAPEAIVLHPPSDAAQFDSEHLWPVLAPLDWSGQRVAIVSGGDADQARGRQWLTAQWQAAGAQVDTVLTYQRGPSHWPDEQARLAAQAWARPRDHIWLASSSEALALLHTHHLPGLAPSASAPRMATPTHRLLATHPRIADTARAWGWQDIVLCAPTLDAVAQALRQAP